MADSHSLAILARGVQTWNVWRKERSVAPDLSHAKLSGGMDLKGANLADVNLEGADLTGANLGLADLRRANLRRCSLTQASLREAVLDYALLDSAFCGGALFERAVLDGTVAEGIYLINADLRLASLKDANLRAASLKGARLTAANFKGANLFAADLEGCDASDVSFEDADLRNASLRFALINGASLNGCRISGLAWQGMSGRLVSQTDLIITNPEDPEIVVDHLGLAQFVELLLYHASVREVITNVRANAVLVFGDFGQARKVFLKALRAQLRQRAYLPIMVDLAKPPTRDLTETITVLASMARFVVADMTQPRSVPMELGAIVPKVSVPVVPLLRRGEPPYAMFVDTRNPWVLDTLVYDDDEALAASVDEAIVRPAEEKARELGRT